jgi:hypothetical protein
MTKALLILAFGAMALIGSAVGGDAADRRTKKMVSADTVENPKARHYRKRVRVYGYAARRGGYSYKAEDVVNTYGLSRSLYGSVNTWRDPFADRQTTSGPFDHDFFFDSGMGPRGGDSPYLH